MVVRFFLRTRFVIPLGPGALSGDALLIAVRTCCSVMVKLHGTGSGYLAPSISRRSAGGGEGKKDHLNSSVLALWVVICPSLRVGIYRMFVSVVELRYVFTCHIVFSSAELTNSVHVFRLALSISCSYSLTFALHV